VADASHRTYGRDNSPLSIAFRILRGTVLLKVLIACGARAAWPGGNRESNIGLREKVNFRRSRPLENGLVEKGI